MLKEYDEVFHIECEKEISREEGRAEERVNTERERRRAEVAEQKAEAAEQKAKVFKLMMHGKTKEEIADITGIALEEAEQIMSEV